MMLATKLGIRKIHRDSFHASYGAGRYLLALLWYKLLCGADVDTNDLSYFDEAVTDEERKKKNSYSRGKRNGKKINFKADKITMNRKTFLFDFDGTLVDSMPTFVSLMLRILDENKIKYGDDIVKIITPLGYLGTAKYFKKLGIELETDELIELMNRYASEAYTYRIPAKEGVIRALEIMRERGYGLNILTASPHSVLDVCLKRLGIFELFDNVWSCDDFGTSKADPEIYKMAAQRLGYDVGEVIFVDDNINAVKTAKSAGMISFGIYDDSSADLVDEMRGAADGYVMSFEELL